MDAAAKSMNSISVAPLEFALRRRPTFCSNSIGLCHTLLHNVRALVNVAIHASQFPDNVRRDLLASLRARQVNHKFLYDSVKQTQKWLALHQACAPSRSDADCAAAYDRAFAAAAARIRAPRVHLIGLGCGGGQKDTRLLKLLRRSGREVFYTPADVSPAMVLVAHQTALGVIPERHCYPLVCDLASAEDLQRMVGQAAHLSSVGLAARSQAARAPARLVTFFGMLPNFEPHIILPRLKGLLRSSDSLLLSANLAPGPDYSAGVRQVLPQYDNDLTRDWLMTFLLELGVEAGDGGLEFRIEKSPSGPGLKRIAAYFQFVRPREIQLDAHRFKFGVGQSIRLFFSYRHTPALVRTSLCQHGLRVLNQWITESEEEGVFLVG